MKRFFFRIKSTLGCVYRGTQEAFKSSDSKRRTRYAYYYKYCKVRDHVVLYESFYGKGMLCNPYAIFLELLGDPEFKDYIHVWVLKDPKVDQVLIDRYRDHKNVIFVPYGGKTYLKYLATAKYLFNNSTFGNYFVKKKEQVYVNTWHGIPLKTLGYDMPNGPVESTNVVRNFLQTDYMISASPFLTEIYQKSYRLEHLYGGKIIEEGYPRLDILVRSDRNEVLNRLRSYGVGVDGNKKIILFAPTWRGTTFAQASSDISFCYALKERLEQIIDTTQYQILIKLHQQVFELVRDTLSDDFFVPSMIDANEMLAVTDILINDFSSIYFDFLATGRPVLFYIPDLELYSEQRGLYRGTESLPGPCTDSVEELGSWINQIETTFAENQHKYDAEREWSNGYTDGSIAKKIVDIVFRRNEEGYKIHQPALDKKRILVSRGRMRVNGISTSLLSFLENLDYERFDVTLMLQSTSVAEEKKLMSRIPSGVRIMVRNSGNSVTIGERILHIYYGRTFYKNPFHPMYWRDVQRSYGDAEFDYVIDFDGYNAYYSVLALQYQNATRCIWQHSDLMAEKDLRFPWLDSIFKLYRHFDRIVSCAYDVMLVNREKLKEYAGPERFAYMKNFIDLDRITGFLGKAEFRSFEGQEYLLLADTNSRGMRRLDLIPGLAPGAMENGQRLYRFVAMGRFSPEKNYENLVAAFERLHQEYSNVYLYILGDGPEKKEIDRLIGKLALRDRIITPGNLENPFMILEHCDCFILPSLHEGQPMVINEARVLKLPIIVSNFSSVKGVLIENGQLVIDTGVEDIYLGMKKCIQGEVPSDYPFRPEEYNREAYREFLGVLGESDGIQ